MHPWRFFLLALLVANNNTVRRPLLLSMRNHNARHFVSFVLYITYLFHLLGLFDLFDLCDFCDFFSFFGISLLFFHLC